MGKNFLCKKSFSALLAFTLAEVLIVLGIIGVVAEMTIPTLVANTQKQVLKTSFKKAYSTVSQAVEYTKLDLDVSDLHTAYTYYDGSSYVYQDEYKTSFYKQLKVMGDQPYSSPPANFNKTAGAYWYSIGTEAPTHMLPDGSSIDCMINAGMINISVDLNGPLKKPNRVGYDIFGFYVDTRDTVQPYNPDSWVWGAGYAICDTSSLVQNGLGCGYYALLDKNPADSTKGYWDSLQ